MSERQYRTRIKVENYVKDGDYEEVFRSCSGEVGMNENIFGAVANIISISLDLSIAKEHLREAKEKKTVVYCKKVLK